MANHKKYCKGKVVASPSLDCGEFRDSMYAHGSSMHQKCFTYALTNLLFSLCNSIWNPLVIHFNPHPGTSTWAFDPWNAMSYKTHPNSFFLLFSHGIHIWVFQRVWGCVTQYQSFGKGLIYWVCNLMAPNNITFLKKTYYWFNLKDDVEEYVRLVWFANKIE
jgi:hypothetical protein